MAIDRIHPNAAGDETNLTPSNGDNYACVDEWIVNGDTHDGATTQVVHPTADDSWKRDLYNVGATSGSGSIGKITVKAYALWIETGTAPSTPEIKLSVKPSSGAVDEKAAENITEDAFALHTEEWAVNPADSEAWEWADLADLQIGVNLHGTWTDNKNRGLPSCTQIYLEITYADQHTETIDITSLFRDTDTDTLALDSRIEAKDTKTADLTSLIQALEITSTADLTALIKALADTKTANLDVRLGYIFETTLTLDTFLGHRYVIDGRWQHRPAHKVVIEKRGGGDIFVE